MTRPLVSLAALVAALALAPVAAAQAPIPTPPPTPVATPAPPPGPEARVIAEGVTAGGVAVGGLTIAQATDVLAQKAGRKASRRVIVAIAGKRYYLPMSAIRMRLDAERTAKRAYYAGRDKGPNSAVTLALRWRRSTVAGFVARVDQRASIAPRDAWLEITVRKMVKHRAKTGRSVDERALRSAIDLALADPARTRVIKPGRKAVKPRVNANDLAAQNPTVLTIDRSTYTLRVFKRLKFSKRYGIAVGAAGYETPSGLYRIQNKQVNPAWHAPNRPWAGSYAGKTVPGGAPNNPLKARWLGIVNGVGIHGTGEPWSIGTRASHGCIRMRVPDVIDLYPRVPVGSRVLIR